MSTYNMFGDPIKPKEPDPSIAAAKAAEDAAAKAEADRIRTLEIEYAAAKAREKALEDAERIANERVAAIERATFASAPKPEAKAVEATNPYNPDEDPSNYQRWEIQKDVRNILNEFTTKVINPAAQRINSEIAAAKSMAAAPLNKQIENDPYFKLVNADFNAEMSKLPADEASNPEMRQTVLDLVKGRNIDAIVAAKMANAANPSEGGNSISAPRSLGKPILTEQDKKMAGVYGMTDEQWATEKESMGLAVRREA